MMRTTRPTISDVARLAEVSKTTVSYVITGNGSVSDERRAKIEEAIDRLRYRPNALARSLSSRRMTTIGVMSADAADPFVAKVTSGIIAEASAHDILVIVGVHRPSTRGADVSRTASGLFADAVIYVSGERTVKGDDTALSKEPHVVVLVDYADGAPDSTAGARTPAESIGRAAVRMLLHPDDPAPASDPSAFLRMLVPSPLDGGLSRPEPS